MGYRLTDGHFRGLLRIACWTGALAALLISVDRIGFGPSAEGWKDARTPPAFAPAYLPGVMTWPPKQGYLRTRPHPGWWWRLDDAQGNARIWIGEGMEPFPREMDGLTGCMSTDSPCREGWRFYLVERPERKVLLFSQLSDEESRRIIDGLQFEKLADR